MIKNLLKWRLFKGIAITVLIAFVGMIPAQSGYAQTFMPAPGQMVRGTSAFTPTLMKGLRVDISNPFNLYFLMSDGEKALAGDARQQEYEKLIKYFMASLVIPNRDMWVNLSPKESTRIIPDNFSMTDMGRDLLSQDYLLKQFTASLMYPEDDLGKQFWNQIYQKAYQEYGTTDIPVDTFNKVWIKVDRADIYQKDDTAFVVKSHLKVMLEQDLLAAQGSDASLQGGISEEGDSGPRKMASDIVRNVIIPVIEKEVNEGGNFATVRQAYHAMILATWFKKTLKDTLLGQVYADQSKVDGIALNDPQAKDRIYQQYLAAYKTGVFNYIKEEYDSLSQETLPRKYFAGGLQALSPDGQELAMAHPLLASRVITEDRSHQDVLFVNLVDSASGRVFENRAALEQDQSQKAMATIKEEKGKNVAQQAQAKLDVEKRRQRLGREIDRVNAQRVKALAAVANASARVNRVAVHKKERAVARQTLRAWLANKFQKVLLVTAIAQSLFATPIKAAEAPNMPLAQPPAVMGNAAAGQNFIPNTNAIAARQLKLQENKAALEEIVRDLETAVKQRAATELGFRALLLEIEKNARLKENNIQMPEIPLEEQIAYLRKSLEFNKKLLAQRVTEVTPPITGGLVPGQSGPMGSYAMPLAGAPASLIVKVHYPGEGLVDMGVLANGIATGGGGALGVWAGPPVLLDLLLQKGNKYTSLPTQGQSFSIRPRTSGQALVNSVILNRVERRSHDMNGEPVITHPLRVSLLQNIGTFIGRAGRLFKDDSDLRGISGGADGSYTWDTKGALVAGPFEKVFKVAAAQNRDSNVIRFFDYHRYNGVVPESKFAQADRKNGGRILKEALDKGILERVTRGVRLKRNQDGSTNPLPTSMQGGDFQTIRDILRPEQQYVITDPEKRLFRYVKEGESVEDPYYDASVTGFEMKYLGIDPKTGGQLFEVKEFCHSDTLMNNATAREISGLRTANKDWTILEALPSNTALVTELAFKESQLTGGGVLALERSRLSLLAKGLVTDWGDLLGLESDDRGVLQRPSSGEAQRPIQLTPAKRAHEFTTGEKLWTMLTSEFTEPLEWLRDTSGKKELERYQSGKDGKYKYNNRPIVNRLPYGFGNPADRMADRVDLGRRVLDLEKQIQDADNVGAIYHLYNKQPDVIPDVGGLKATLEKHSLKNTFWMFENSRRVPTDPKYEALPANAKVDGDALRVTFGSGRSLLLPLGTLVQIEDGKITGIFRPNIATMKKWTDAATTQEEKDRLETWGRAVAGFGYAVDPTQENPVLVPVLQQSDIDNYKTLQFEIAKVTDAQKDPASGDYILPGISKPVSGKAMVKIQDGKVVEIFVPGAAAIKAHNDRLEAEQKALEAGAREVGVEVFGEPGRFIPTIFTRGPVSAEQAPFKMGGEDRLVDAVASNHVQVVSGVDEAGHVYWEPQITLAQQPVKAGFSPAETAPTMTEFLAKNVMASFLRDGVIAKSEFAFNDRDGKGRFPEGQEIRGALKAKGILKEVSGGLQLESRENLEKIVRDSKMSFQDILLGTVRDV
ncbi:MAG: hypothetical protein HQL21_04235, partial [Candidatus Omnitrophica bacterium]|nr:hypothetical protein [Candidatus Omnitrophota bacterium]